VLLEVRSRVAFASLFALAVTLTACSDDLGDAVPTDSAPASVTSQPATSTGGGSTTTRVTTSTVVTTTINPASTTTAPPAGAPALQMRKGTTGRPAVALTFDAGSDTGFTAQILDTLATERIKGSFGLTGRWAEQNPDLVRRIVADGHHLVNHTYSHRSWTGFSSATAPLNRDVRISELDKAEQAFKTIANATAKPWFRPPFGDVDTEMDRLLGQMGYKYNALWTVDSLGWMGKTAAQIVEICRKGIVPGGILLFHVGSQSQDANALLPIIQEIRAAGLQPGSLLDVV
jgi:peptidoglycan/xylan/chitin deacetylase (PgdA/CDA1 family)